jgi:ParB/RepB/Spo0J family partition protein
MLAEERNRPEGPSRPAKDAPPRVQQVPVAKIRPEEGLGRKRDREGHRELCRSIEQFGVLTPITVRRAPDATGDYLLIKGQGRTLACRLLGIDKIPAIVMDDRFAGNEKVQQFLVENVARLRMRPIDRALLIARARKEGEETAGVARRFGVSAATVRRLEAQLEGATSGEVAALKSGNMNLAACGYSSLCSSQRETGCGACGGTVLSAAQGDGGFVRCLGLARPSSSRA